MIIKIIATSTLFFFLSSSYAETITPVFRRGIQKNNAARCVRKIQHGPCSLKKMLGENKGCTRKELSKIPYCKQTLKLFNLTEGALFKKMRQYHHIQVIKTKYNNIANQSTLYVLITATGHFMMLPIQIPADSLSQAPGYKHLVKKYPHLTPWQILRFPHAIRLRHRYRLIFDQRLRNGCNACESIGVARVAYDFSPNAHAFYGIHVLKLIR